jgi:hypothetical protein
MIRSVTGSHNRASPSSSYIPLIRLKELAFVAMPTPDELRMSYTARVTEPRIPSGRNRLNLSGSFVSFPLVVGGSSKLSPIGHGPALAAPSS